MRTALLVVLVAMAGAAIALSCRTFEASLPEGLDASGSSATPSGGTAPDATDRPDDGGSRCDGGCLVFEDHFERDPQNLLGNWTETVGKPMLLADPNGQTYLFASLKGYSVEAPVEAFLSKSLEPGKGLSLALRQSTSRSVIAPDAGALDYCELAAISLGTNRIAMLYYQPTAVKARLFGPDELAWEETVAAVASSTWTEARLVLVWSSGSQVALTGAIGGVSLTPVVVPLKPGLSMMAPRVRVGLRCVGETPAVTVKIDDVVVRDAE